MPVLTHVVKILQSLYFHNRQLNVRFSKLNYDDGSKYGFIQNATFLDNLSISYYHYWIIIGKQTKKKKMQVSYSPQVSLYVPVTIIFRYVKLQHNMTDIKQVHL